MIYKKAFLSSIVCQIKEPPELYIFFLCLCSDFCETIYSFFLGINFKKHRSESSIETFHVHANSTPLQNSTNCQLPTLTFKPFIWFNTAFDLVCTNAIFGEYSIKVSPFLLKAVLWESAKKNHAYQRPLNLNLYLVTPGLVYDRAYFWRCRLTKTRQGRHICNRPSPC